MQVRQSDTKRIGRHGKEALAAQHSHKSKSMAQHRICSHSRQQPHRQEAGWHCCFKYWSRTWSDRTNACRSGPSDSAAWVRCPNARSLRSCAGPGSALLCAAQMAVLLDCCAASRPRTSVCQSSPRGSSAAC